MARKNSTTAPTGIRTHLCSDSRPMPSRAPIGSAITIDSPAASRVFTRPGSRNWVQVDPSTNGFQRAPAHWPFWAKRS